jgi:mediator of RNA polymerase II transcription subunit 18
MHELFITSVVPDRVVIGTLQILQGLCGMNPVHKYERRLVFEGPRAPPLKGIATAHLQSRNRANNSLWKELHGQLIRQSYYITVMYEIDEIHFGDSRSSEDDPFAETAS